jgi:hypothetical protein
MLVPSGSTDDNLDYDVFINDTAQMLDELQELED